MPTYDYQCLKCRRKFERFQRITEKPLTRCPHCKGKIERLIGSAGLIFKGSGFYITDYKKKPEPGSKKSEVEKTKPKTGKNE